ncbi:hypothetical protein CEXT_517742 [Caerostris extrusa]|uniref:Cyclic nucleotide-binding domain-containing protein n=1 Tax=Caerostris extrusa TaxID=172846 RepID=A0AAV4V7R6_CAEEX|nr:hypothetical protein CEXT_517742 [Caerostris extrusa]
MKGFFWKQFRNGLIQRRTLKFLSVAVDNASDIQYKYLKTEDVSSKFVALKKINHCLERNILRLLAKIKLKESSFDREMHELRSAHQISIKIITLGLRRYLKSILNKIDLVLTLIAVIEGSVDFFLMSYYPSKHSYFSHIRILIALRLFRIVRVLRILIYNLLLALMRMCSTELYYAYDISCGFLFANEVIVKKIDAIVDFGPCVHVPLSICRENITEMFDYLAEFEQEFPAVSFALKSNRAARQILNRLKRVLKRCSERSLVSREDMELLKTILFKMTKKVVYAPRFRPVISDSSKILEECVWIKYAGASNIILENHTICSYTNGEIIVNAGNNHQFVYIIASGIVKVLYYKTKSKISLYEMYNELPNTDTFLIFDSRANVDVWEFLVPSQTLGLLGYLQKNKSVTTAICEKIVS